MTIYFQLNLENIVEKADDMSDSVKCKPNDLTKSTTTNVPPVRKSFDSTPKTGLYALLKARSKELSATTTSRSPTPPSSTYGSPDINKKNLPSKHEVSSNVKDNEGDGSTTAIPADNSINKVENSFNLTPEQSPKPSPKVAKKPPPLVKPKPKRQSCCVNILC